MIPASVRIFLCTQPQDMRCGFERLALAARRVTDCDPRDGQALFCFVNKRRNRIKVLWHDGTNGWCLLYKRLHGALFEIERTDVASSIRVDHGRFAALLRGVKSQRRGRRS